MIRLPVIKKFIKRQFSKDISSNVSTSKRQFFEPHYQISVRTAYGDTMTGKFHHGKFNIGIGFRLDSDCKFHHKFRVRIKKITLCHGKIHRRVLGEIFCGETC